MEGDFGGFGDLLQQAEQLTADMDGDGELPRVERNLRQIVDAGQQLWSRTAQAVSKDGCDVKASILLGTKGFDLPMIAQKLEGLSQAKTFEPIEPIRETDIQGFLKNERENAMLSVIEEAKKSTFERADRLFWETLESKWEQEKQRILNAMTGPTHEVLDLDLESELYSSSHKSMLAGNESHYPMMTPKGVNLDMSVRSDAVNMRTRSAMDRVEMAYAKEIYQYNEQVVQGGMKHSLADKVYDIFSDLEERKIMELWEMVKYMTDVPLSPNKDILASRNSLLMQTSFVRQARKYLEKKYFEYIQAIVFGNLKEADLGSRPGTYFLVRSFLKIRLPTLPPGLEDGVVDDNPIWAVIYYCLRCGNLDAAVESANKAGESLSNFVPFLTEYCENEGRRLNPTSEGQIRLQYRRTVRSSTDPFKRAVFGILGCDISDDNSEVADKIDDYVWLKLCRLHMEEENVDMTQTDKVTLPRLQKMLLEDYGESYFSAYQKPHLYFQVLFLTAQFEAAIEFLSRIESLRCHAVHVALVLYELNLLALPKSHQAPLLSKVSSDKPPMRRLNFSRLIMMYTKKFEVTDPREALQYFYVLRDLKAVRDISLFMACVSELVLETREFEMLLGKIELDGCRKPGAIDKFEYDTQAIIEIVASDSENKGQYEDAIKLYDLAKKQDKVLEILNKLLSQIVPSVSAPGSNRQRMESIAIAIAERYKSQGHTANSETAGTFFLLLDLMTFFNLAHSHQYVEALDAIKSLKLLPFTREEVEQKVSAFSLYAEEVRRNFPDVLLATMNILYSEYRNAKQSLGLLWDQKSPEEYMVQEKSEVFPRKSAKQYMNYLSSQARALITFAGMIPYRMPGDANAKLVQLEVMMN